MTPKEFLTFFSLLEHRLFTLKPTFSKEVDFIQLLKELEKDQTMNSETLKSVYSIFKVRNQLLSSDCRLKVVSKEHSKALLDLLERKVV